MTTRPSISWLTNSANSALTTLFVSPCAPATLASLALQTGPNFLSQGLARAVPFTLEPSPPPLLTLCLPHPLHPLGLGLNVTSPEGPPCNSWTKVLVSLSASYLDSYLILITLCSNMFYLYARLFVCLPHWTTRPRTTGTTSIMFTIVSLHPAQLLIHSRPSSHTGMNEWVKILNRVFSFWQTPKNRDQAVWTWNSRSCVLRDTPVTLDRISRCLAYQGEQQHRMSFLLCGRGRW